MKFATALIPLFAAQLYAHASPCANSLNKLGDTSVFEFAVPPMSAHVAVKSDINSDADTDLEIEVIRLVRMQLRGINLGNTFTIDFRVVDGVLLIAITNLDPRLRMPIAKSLLNRWDLIDSLQKLEHPLHLEFTP